MKKILLIFILAIMFFGWRINFQAGNFVVTESKVAYAQFAGDTGGLVPCGHGTNVDNRCTLCDLFVGIDRIIKWGRNILVAVALTALVAGGIMYIVSAGNQQMMENAKTLIQQALVGVLIVLGAWLIVNTVIWLLVVKSGMGVGAGDWWNFDCNAGGVNTSTPANNGTNSQQNQGGGEQSPSCPSGQHPRFYVDVNTGDTLYNCVPD